MKDNYTKKDFQNSKIKDFSESISNEEKFRMIIQACMAEYNWDKQKVKAEMDLFAAA